MISYKQFNIKKQYVCFLIFLTGLLIAMNFVSCRCGGGELIATKVTPPTQLKGKRQEEGKIIMEVSPTSLEGEQRIADITFRLKDNKKIAKLTNYTIAITSIGTLNSISQSRPSVSKNVADFCSVTELTPDQKVLKIPYEVVADKEKFDLVTVEFKLTDNKGSAPVIHNVTWKKAVVPKVQLKFAKLVHDPINNTVTYCIQNDGTEEAKDVELYYKNISKDAIEKLVELDNKQEGTIKFPRIATGGLTGNQTLPIDFKSATKVTFKFDIIYKAGVVENGTKEVEFKINVPQLKLVPLSLTQLVGENKEIRFKIEKASDGFNIEPSKLRLQITETSGSNAAIKHKRIVVAELVGNELEAIGNTNHLIIEPGTAVSAEFMLQLIYDGSIIDDAKLFIKWQLDVKGLTEELFRAIEDGDALKVERLLKVPGINVNATDKGGNTPLHVAVRKGKEAIVKLLMSAGANVNAKSIYGSFTPLYIAASQGRIELMDLLISQGANVNIPMNTGYTPLHRAVERGDEAAVETLLKVKDINVNTISNSRENPLYSALWLEDKVILEALIAKGANVNIDIPGADSNIPLHRSIIRNDQAAVEALLKAKDINVNVKDNKGYTPLQLAIKLGNQAAVETLLKAKGIDVNITDEYGNLPLHMAIGLGKKIVEDFLAIKGINVNAQDGDKDTPLHIAVKCNELAIVKLLLEKQAKENIKDAQGETTVDLARRSTNEEIKRLFGITNP